MVMCICSTVLQKGLGHPRTVVPTWVLELVPKDNEGQLCIPVYFNIMSFPRVFVEN